MILRRPSLIAFAAVAVTLAACGGGGDAASDTAAEETAAVGDAVGQGIAATVNGTGIERTLLDSRVEDAAASPQLAEVLANDESGQARTQIRASVLSQLIVNRIVLDGADEMGLEVDDEAVAATREELVTEVGGEDAFAEEVEAAGLDDEELEQELVSIAALRLVREEVAGAAEDARPEGESTSPGQTPAGVEPTVDPADAALEQWLLEQVQRAEIEVDPEIGTWDAAQATVVPAGLEQSQLPGAGAPAAPEAPATDEGAEPAPTEGDTATESG